MMDRSNPISLLCKAVGNRATPHSHDQVLLVKYSHAVRRAQLLGGLAIRHMGPRMGVPSQRAITPDKPKLP